MTRRRCTTGRQSPTGPRDLLRSPLTVLMGVFNVGGGGRGRPHADTCRHALGRMSDFGWTDVEIMKMVGDMDTDNDGKICLEEWMAVYIDFF